MNTMQKHITQKQEEVAQRKQEKPQAALAIQAKLNPPPRNFLTALKAPGVSLIAEVAIPPSKGWGDLDVEPVTLARIYENNGAAAISVCTGKQFFEEGLDNEDFCTIRQAVDIPVLYKDFIVDLYQIYAARAAGADAVLLIVAALDDAAMYNFYALARYLGMAAMVEVHTLPELRRGLGLRPRLMSINNRDLSTDNVNLDTTADLRARLPSHVTVVAENGIYTPQDVVHLAKLKVDAMLVGEVLVNAEDTAGKVRALVGGEVSKNHIVV